MPNENYAPSPRLPLYEVRDHDLTIDIIRTIQKHQIEILHDRPYQSNELAQATYDETVTRLSQLLQDAGGPGQCRCYAVDPEAWIDFCRRFEAATGARPTGAQWSVLQVERYMQDSTGS